MLYPGQTEEPVLVLGIGNILNTDEGVGVHLARALQAKYPTPKGFAISDGGTLGLNLLPMVDDADYLIILDAVSALKPPGSIIQLADEQIPLFGQVRLSEHQLTFQEVLGLSMLRGTLPPHMLLIGVQPDDLSVGVGLSPAVQAALPAAIEAVEAALRAWGVALDVPTRENLT